MLSDDGNISSDEKLVEAIIQNNQEAFRQLYYKYFNALLRFAWFRLYSMETAHDLVQESFVKLWVTRSRLNPLKSVKAYLYKILNNLIINQKKLFSSKSISLEQVDELKNSIDESNIDLKLDILNAIEKLPSKLKSVYTLSRYEMFSYAEIAEICSISIKAVEKRMSKSLVILRKTFPQNYFE